MILAMQASIEHPHEQTSEPTSRVAKVIYRRVDHYKTASGRLCFEGGLRGIFLGHNTWHRQGRT